MQLRIAAAVAAAVALAASGAGVAEAYPQFQFSTDNARCTLCHVAPAGGGVLNGWGRGESADTISAWGGDGALLHGLWDAPDWLRLGGDYRGVLGAKTTSAEQADLLFFPMQLDLYTGVEVGAWSVALTIGARGKARPRDPPAYTLVGSREHYVMWRPKTTGPYVRAGKFFAPFSLRQVDHTLYVRRDNGMYAWQEPYGISGGYVVDAWELHVSAYVPDPIVKTGDQTMGAAALYERRFDDEDGAWGAQAKVDRDGESTKLTAGGLGKLWLAGADLLLLGELDVALETFSGAGSARTGVLAHVNASWFPAQGWLIGATLEHVDPDLAIRGTERVGFTGSVQLFPRAHWEVMLFGRAEHASGASLSTLAMLMWHYYL